MYILYASQYIVLHAKVSWVFIDGIHSFILFNS